MNFAAPCSEVSEASQLRLSAFGGDFDDLGAFNCCAAAWKIGLSERRTSRRRMYSRMRGLDAAMTGCLSLKALKSRVEQEEQRKRLQVLHRGQEQLRRNIKVRRLMYSGQILVLSKIEALWCHGQTDAHDGRDVMTWKAKMASVRGF